MDNIVLVKPTMEYSNELHNCKHYGLNKVLTTCDEDNFASEKIILANGGVFEHNVCVDGVKIKRYWIDLSDK